MDEQLRVIPIHRSLTRPLLLMGCDRVLFLMLCMVVTLLAGPGGLMTKNYINMILSLFIFIGGRGGLVLMAKTDSQMSDVFRRSTQYCAEYPAVTTVGYKNAQKPRRW